MKQIKSFPFKVEPTQKISLPFNSEIISIWSSEDGPSLVAIIDSDHKDQERTLVIIAKDKEVPQRLNKTHYIGSFQYQGHSLCVFEE